MKIGFYRDWIYDELKENIGEKEAANVVGLIFDKIKSPKGVDEVLNVENVIPAMGVINKNVESDYIDPIDIANNTAKLFDDNDVANSVQKMIEYLEKNTGVMHNKIEYGVYQNLIYDELTKTIGEEEAAKVVWKICDKVISDRGFDEALHIDGVNVNVIKDINWNNAQTDLQSVENMIRNMPEELRECVNEINIMDLYNPQDKISGFDYNIPDFKASCTTNTKRGEINIFGLKRELPEGEIYHEAAHCWDCKIPGYRISDQEFWSNAMQADMEMNKGEIGVTPYATQAKNATGKNAEDFAESVRLLKEDPDYFKANYPNRYEVLNAILTIERN